MAIIHKSGIPTQTHFMEKKYYFKYLLVKVIIHKINDSILSIFYLQSSFQTCFLLWNTSSITSELLVFMYLESYGVGMSLGWITNDKIVFGWTISLRSNPYFVLFIFRRSSMGRSLCTHSRVFCPALFLSWSVLFKVLKPLPQSFTPECI